jgi:hypothetical protein
MAGFDNDVMYAKNADFTQADNQAVSEANGLATNGQLWIGSTALNGGGTHVNVGTITSPDGSFQIGYTSPNITLVANTPNSRIFLSDDFIAATVGLTGAQLNSELIWNNSAIVMATNPSAVVTAANPGVLSNLAIPNGFSNYAFLSSAQSLIPTIVFGGGVITLNWVFNPAILSAASPRYILRLGFGSTAGADQVNGAYFEYSDNINSGNWVLKTAAASSRTTTNTATPVTTGFKNFQITVNAAGTSCEFFIDGVSQGTIAATMPTAAVMPFFDGLCTVGTVAANSLIADTFYMTKILTVAR